jgi:hypothetical protein
MTRTLPHSTTAQVSAEERSVHHRVLAVERRRTTCDVLGEYDDGPASLDALAERVSARDADVVTDEAVQQVATTLHHVHLPMLDAAGVVEYDPDAKRAWPDPETLARYVN